jgi:hypothetical protein
VFSVCRHGGHGAEPISRLLRNPSYGRDPGSLLIASNLAEGLKHKEANGVQAGSNGKLRSQSSPNQGNTSGVLFHLGCDLPRCSFTLSCSGRKFCLQADRQKVGPEPEIKQAAELE